LVLFILIIKSRDIINETETALHLVKQQERNDDSINWRPVRTRLHIADKCRLRRRWPP